MKIGTTLHLKVSDPNTNDFINCRCKIIGEDETYLYVDYPVHMNTNRTCFLSEGTMLLGTYLSHDKSLLQFQSQVIKRIKRTVPALAISNPKSVDIKHIQRREFVRIHVATDVAVHSIDGTFESFTTVTNDISAGGLSIIIPKGINWTKGKEVSLSIVLYTHSKTNYIHVNGEMIRMKLLKNSLQTASIQFVHISNHMRQDIIQYCFEKQREERKKELI